MVSEKIIIDLATGLHARPATSLINMIKETGCKVNFQSGEKRVNASSILSVLSLGLKKGAELEIFVDGENEEVVLQKIVSFINELED